MSAMGFLFGFGMMLFFNSFQFTNLVLCFARNRRRISCTKLFCREINIFEYISILLNIWFVLKLQAEQVR